MGNRNFQFMVVERRPSKPGRMVCLPDPFVSFFSLFSIFLFCLSCTRLFRLSLLLQVRYGEKTGCRSLGDQDTSSPEAGRVLFGHQNFSTTKLRSSYAPCTSLFAVSLATAIQMQRPHNEASYLLKVACIHHRKDQQNKDQIGIDAVPGPFNAWRGISRRGQAEKGINEIMSHLFCLS